MTPQFKENVETLVSVLSNARINVLEIASTEPLLSATKIRIDTQMSTLINSIKAQLGYNPDVQSEKIIFGPIEKLDGQDFKTPNVTPELLVPTIDDTQALKEKVLSLQSALSQMTNGEIIKNYITNSDLLAIRGLAKKAGIVDYNEAEINENLIAGIREKLQSLNQRAEGDKAAILAQIKQATTKEQVEELAKGNDDEEIQNAALDKIIEIGE